MSSNDGVPTTTVSAKDWTALLPESDHARYFTSIDWATTEVGPLSAWPLELRLNILQAFADTRPVCIWWGPSWLAIYNDAFVPLLGNKHPAALGVRFVDVFGEVAHVFLPYFDEIQRTRKASCFGGEDMPISLKRNQFVEETYFSANAVPILLQSGMIGGIFNTAPEVTLQNLTERRRRMLNLISAPSVQLTSTSVYQHMAACFQTNRLDIPFALLYKIDTEIDDGNHELRLLSSVGLSQAEKLISRPTRLHDNISFLPFLRAAQRQIITTTITEGVGDIDWERVEWAGHGQPSQVFTTIPVLSAEQLSGFLILGCNPQRPVDTHHDQFMSDIQRYTTTVVMACMSAEESLKRNEQLQARLAERERQVRYMAQHADITMMQLALDGTVIWANERYRTIVNENDENVPRQTFIGEDHLIPADRPLARATWFQVLEGKKVDTTELRLQRQYTPPTGSGIPSTILLSTFPYMEGQEVKSIMACMTDVSRLKWAETWQAQIAHDAKEAKRQQSEFTDAISHEVRNPLSAILQLADSITTSCDGLQEPTVQDCMSRLEETAHAARTILSCARHQKRIVDDVLTLSRMDLSSISLSPAPTQLDNLVQELFRMFEAEAEAGMINLQVLRNSSLSMQVPDQIMCDSLRVTQILINLLSNAIKFTKQQIRRAITVTYGVTTSNPQQTCDSRIVWAPQQQELSEDFPQQEQWGDGELLFLIFSIEDTGPGMTSEEMTRIFDRFQQASARTAIQYGGSGLGLFISRSLIEKQGGRIGAFSEVGLGSTFVFYVTALRVRAVPEPSVHTVDGRNQRPSVNGDAPSKTDPSRTRTNTMRGRQPSSTTSKFHFLLVEDNIINQQILRKQLVKGGHEVQVANHGIEALAVLRASSLWVENQGQGPHIDFVLMDWEMPVMDGLTCTREIRTMEQAGCFTSHPKVIAVTANVRPEQVRTAKVAGVDTLVPKPFTVTELLEVVNQYLRK